MTPRETIKTEPLLFDKILEPISEPLEQLNKHPISQASGKLFYDVFIRLLLFRIFAQIESLRDLKRDLKTNFDAQLLKLPVVGLSTLHDAFARYPVQWVVQLIQQVMANFPFPELDELKALGQVWVADSSYWPIVRQLGWLRSQGLEGVRLHLGLSLNTMCVTALMLTYDASSTSTEKACLLAIAQAGITYVMDRGYVSIAFCRSLIDKGAFFVLRERNNTAFRVLCELPVDAHPCLQRLTSIRDQIGKFQRDKDGTILRLVSFTVGGHQFRLLTNRFDLTTSHIILLYAWRWQVELIFRAWKHTLGGLHLINLSESGIATQFYILLLASLLWTLLQQTCESLAPTARSDAARKPSPSAIKTITGQVSQVFQVGWRLLRPALRLCKNCLAQSFSFYLIERQTLT